MDLTALVFLPLLGGYLFSVTWKHTSFEAARESDQRIYFRAGCYAVLLVLLCSTAHIYIFSTSENYRAFLTILGDEMKPINGDKSSSTNHVFDHGALQEAVPAFIGALTPSETSGTRKSLVAEVREMVRVALIALTTPRAPTLFGPESRDLILVSSFVAAYPLAILLNAPWLMIRYVYTYAPRLAPGKMKVRTSELVHEYLLPLLLKRVIATGTDFERLLATSTQKRLPVLFTLTSNKVYVGWVLHGMGKQSPYIGIFPALSGYRDPTTQEVSFTVNYSTLIDQLFGASENGSVLAREDFHVVFPADAVTVAHGFDLKLYAASNTSRRTKEDWPTVQQLFGTLPNAENTIDAAGP